MEIVEETKELVKTGAEAAVLGVVVTVAVWTAIFAVAFLFIAL